MLTIVHNNRKVMYRYTFKHLFYLQTVIRVGIGMSHIERQNSWGCLCHQRGFVLNSSKFFHRCVRCTICRKLWHQWIYRCVGFISHVPIVENNIFLKKKRTMFYSLYFRTWSIWEKWRWKQRCSSLILSYNESSITMQIDTDVYLYFSQIQKVMRLWFPTWWLITHHQGGKQEWA